MTRTLPAALRRAPATVPALAALVLFVAWSTDQAGFPVTHWAPGGVVILLLLTMAAIVIGVRPSELPAPVRIALASLAAYTALSFLSILWANDRAGAWEGADRTLLYLCVFALFAGWRQKGSTAAALLVAWALALVGVAAFALLHLLAASAGDLQTLLPGGRLTYPSGYANANAAQWLMAFWPALLMARSKQLHWALRGLLAGGAVLLADVALLSQSRGSLYATPLMLVLVFALLPGRVRTFAVVVPVAAAIAASAPSILHVGDRLHAGAVVPGTLHTAIGVSALGALLVAGAVALGATLESRARPTEGTGRRLHRAGGAIALATLLVLIVGALIAAGNPITRLEHGWNSFKGGYTTNGGSNRLLSGLGSNRYDFYRVALDEFAKHPAVGIGVDNFEAPYLRHGRSTETPKYPHSVELRALLQTGLIGVAVAVAGLLAALLALARAARSDDPLAASVAAAALAGFGYWVVHGSVDWFWEFAGLGAPAFALLGIGCALSSQEEPPTKAEPIRAAPSREASPSRLRTPVARGAMTAAGALAVLCACAALAGPWLSRVEVQSAGRIWPTDRLAAYSRLDHAASLDPLSDEPYLIAGGIALRLGEQNRAAGEFTRALQRRGDDAYPMLELGAIASGRGERSRALELLRRAVRLIPREPLAAEALQVVESSKTLSITALNRSILLKARELS